MSLGTSARGLMGSVGQPKVTSVTSVAQWGEHPLTIIGQLADASNTTVLVSTVSAVGDRTLGVYKPAAGARPLHDFDASTLARREVAAWELSEAAGFHCVPHTTWCDGPLGPGSVQVWVGPDGGPVTVPDDVAAEDYASTVGPNFGAGLVRFDHTVPEDWVGVLHADTEDGELVLSHSTSTPVRAITLFDVVVNNADRKAGHIVAGHPPQPVLGIDHGLTFHEHHKLRTILWGFAGMMLTDAETQLVSRSRTALAEPADGSSLAALTEAERVAATNRADTLLANNTFPEPAPTHPNIPWPPI